MTLILVLNTFNHRKTDTFISENRKIQGESHIQVNKQNNNYITMIINANICFRNQPKLT